MYIVKLKITLYVYSEIERITPYVYSDFQESKCGIVSDIVYGIGLLIGMLLIYGIVQ
jgi:hypothetical protein